MEENLNNWLLQKIYYFFYFKLLKFKQNEIKRKLEFCGKNVSLELPLVIYGTENVKIFDNVVINSFVHIWGMGGVEIGENTLIASHVAITSVTHDKNAILYNQSSISNRIIIGKNVWIGAHAVILPGVTIGDNAIIGAGAIVNKNIKRGDIVAGVPAKSIKS